MAYYSWQADPEGGYCTLEGIQNLEKPYRLTEGVQYGDKFPKDAYFPMNPAFPKNLKLADNIYNLGRAIVASERLKVFVGAQHPPHTEFLPVSIHNHKGHVASRDYYIINPNEVVDCIDTEDSEIVWSSIVPDKITVCTKLVLKEEQIDEELLLFRLRYKPSAVLVKESLVRALEEGGFTGLYFVPVQELTL